MDDVDSLVLRRPLIPHVRFCHVYAPQCDVWPDRRPQGQSAAELLAQIEIVNRSVNARIRPRSESEDRWDINVTAGDCEDYALQKRADLLALGWPSTAMRVAIVRTREGRGHAVLLVTIERSTFVLDNLTAEVVLLQQIQYRMLMLQDQDDPRVWLDAG